MAADDTASLAQRLRELAAEWGEELARAAFEREAGGFDPQIRARVALLAFGDGSQVGDVSTGDLAGRDVVKGAGNVAAGAHVEGPVVGLNLGTVIYGRAPLEDERRELAWYLNRLAGRLRRYPLRGLDAQLDDEAHNLEMSQLYIHVATRENYVIAGGPARELGRFFENNDVRQHLRPECHPDWALPGKAVFSIWVQPKPSPHDYAAASQTSTSLIPGGDWPAGVSVATDSELRLLGRELAARAVWQHQQLILLAEPGGGKSTFLRYLGWSLAAQSAGQGVAGELGPPQELLPIILPLRRLSHQLAAHPDPVQAVFMALAAVLADEGVSRAEHLLQEALYRKTILLLFDGLDEVPVESIHGAGRLATLQAIRDFVHLYNGVRCVVTCRTRAFNQTLREVTRWTRAEIARFSLGQIRAFVHAWYQELVLARQIEGRPADQLARTLIDAILSSKKLLAMARNPLLLTMMALIMYHDGSLPRDRPLLYERVLELLLGRWDKVKEGQSLAEAVGQIEWGSERLRPLIDQLSYQAHATASSEDGRGRIDRRVLRDGLIGFFETARLPEPWGAARRCLDYFEQRSGLIVPDGPESYVFAHLTLQEHCAGRHMLLDLDAAALVMSHRQDDRWREPILLGIGVIQKTNPALVDRILSDLIDPFQGPEVKPRARWQRDLIMAAEIGADRDWNYLRTQRVNVDRLQRQIQAGLTELLADATQPLPVGERVRAAYLLGTLGDARYPTTLEEWRAELDRARAGDATGYFCRVGAGAYTVGTNHARAPHAQRPAHRVIFDAPYWIGRFPITNAQWQEYRRAAGTEALPRMGWREFNQPNQPAIAMTHEAAAHFCRWLSRHLGVTVRLPSEEEWEAAARGPRGYIYPWGDQWLDDRAATQGDLEQRAPLSTAPVGCYPAGAAPCGAADLLGNIWEWTQSVWRSYPGSRAPFEERGEHVIRGGGFNSRRQRISCLARAKYHPIYSPEVTGFRVLVADAPGRR